MAIKYNKANLKKIEEIFLSNEFVIRYEKGQFKSGYCILRDKKIIIINRFFKEKGRIESLLDIIQQTELDEDKLTDKSKEFFKSIAKSYSEELSTN